MKRYVGKLVVKKETDYKITGFTISTGGLVSDA
jgi:hypothetical protein